jgi:hypothetical protein
MNTLKSIFLLLAIVMTSISVQADISAQIAQLKNAKKSEKYIIMNKIKRQIAQLNSAQRAKAIRQLRSSMSNSGSMIQTPNVTVPSISNPASGIPAMPTMPTMPVLPPVGDIPAPPNFPMSTGGK